MTLAIANRKGIRIIFPFIDNARWWGGIEACAAFRGKTREDFWNRPESLRGLQSNSRFRRKPHQFNHGHKVTGMTRPSSPGRPVMSLYAPWANGQEFESVKFSRHDYFTGKGDYNYCLPVLYTGTGIGDDTRYLKIEYTGEAQISRVEIKYGQHN